MHTSCLRIEPRELCRDMVGPRFFFFSVVRRPGTGSGKIFSLLAASGEFVVQLMRGWLSRWRNELDVAQAIGAYSKQG